MITRQSATQDSLVTSNFSTFETTDMEIVSAKGMALALELISNRLYSDKILAVVREVCCNALDEHKKHNITRPVEVTITQTDFTVTDFARGLSKEDTQNIFGNFFESTKGGSNDLIGGFGIGSKAPFAYTDSWYVTSHHEGTAYEFLCAKIRKDGFTKPQMTLINTTPTEKTGIVVRVPISETDNYNFHNSFTAFAASAKSSILYNGTATTPAQRKLRKEVSLPRGSTGAYYRSNNWGFYENEDSVRLTSRLTSGYYDYRSASNYGDGNIVLNIGEVAYRFSISNLLDRDAFSGKSRTFRWFVLNHVFEAPIGEITISPNRETIEFDTPTYSALAALLNTAYSEYLTDVQDKANSVKNALNLNTFINVYGKGFFFEFVKLPGLEVTFRSYGLPSNKHVNYFYEEADTVKDYTSAFVGGTMSSFKMVINDQGAGIQQRVHRDKLTEVLGSHNPQSVLFVTQEEADRIANHDFLSAHFENKGLYSDLLAKYEASKASQPKESRARGIRRKGLLTFVVPSTRADTGYVEKRIESEKLENTDIILDAGDTFFAKGTPQFIRRVDSVVSYFRKTFDIQVYVVTRAPKGFEYDSVTEEYKNLYMTEPRGKSITVDTIKNHEAVNRISEFKTICSKYYPNYDIEFAPSSASRDFFEENREDTKRNAELDALCPEIEQFVLDSVASGKNVLDFYIEFAKKNDIEVVDAILNAEENLTDISSYMKNRLFDSLAEKDPSFILELKKNFINL